MVVGQEHPKAVAEWLFAPRRAAPKNGANVSCGYGAKVTDAIDLIGRAAISIIGRRRAKAVSASGEPWKGAFQYNDCPRSSARSGAKDSLHESANLRANQHGDEFANS